MEDEPEFNKMAMPPTRTEPVRMVKMTAPEGETGINPGGHGEFRVVDGQIEVPGDLPQSAHAALAAHGYVRS